MRKKKVQGEMMEQAIDKASQLITLLQRENKDLKKRVQFLDKDCDKLKRQVYELQHQNDQIVKQSKKNEEKLELVTKQLEDSREAIRSMQQSLKKRIQSNKGLHQKISNLTAKLKEKGKECSDLQTKFLSLENENEYLIKKLAEGDQKQNQIRQQISTTCSSREQQLKEAIRLKEAFSRRCEELKADNAALLETAAEYKQRSLNKPTIIEFKPQKQVRPEEPRTTSSAENLLCKLVRKLGIEPQQTAQKQFEQLSSFVDYRLAHIEKLWESIFTKFQGKQWNGINNLKDLHTTSQRIYVYVGELLNKAS